MSEMFAFRFERQAFAGQIRQSKKYRFGVKRLIRVSFVTPSFFYSLKQGHQKRSTSYVEVFMSLLEYFATIETFANLTANPVIGALCFCLHQGLFKVGQMQDSNLNKGQVISSEIQDISIMLSHMSRQISFERPGEACLHDQFSCGILQHLLIYKVSPP